MPGLLKLALLLAPALMADSGAPVDEYQLKAAFLYNFAKFVDWPPQAFDGPEDPIRVCVVGRNPFGGVLREAVEGKRIGERRFEVRELNDARRAGGCQIVFVSSSERERMRSILEQVSTPGVLTVGDMAGFAAEGGVVNFRLDRDRIRIQINLAAAAQRRLRISAKLLSMAQIVR